MELTADAVAAMESIRVPETWSLADAVSLGGYATSTALTAGLPLAILIRHLGRTAYQAGLPGSAPIHDDWAMRKVRVVELFNRSSLLVRLEHEESGVGFAAKHGLPEHLYKAAGGAIPLNSPSGRVGVLAVSGLVEVTDHQFCVDALSSFIAERDPSAP